MFLDESDYRFMVGEVRALARRQALAIHAYALLSDQFYLLATPSEAPALSAAMQALGRRYVRHFNRRYGREGTLWQSRFRGTVLDPDRFLIPAALFVELAPVRAQQVPDAIQYPWTSLAHHLGLQPDPALAEHAVLWRLGNTPFERQAAYRRLLEAGLSQPDTLSIGNAVERGWALGDPAFVASLASRTDRRLTPLPVGRPRGASRTAGKTA